jgi:hypothetical protein
MLSNWFFISLSRFSAVLRTNCACATAALLAAAGAKSMMPKFVILIAEKATQLPM